MATSRETIAARKALHPTWYCTDPDCLWLLSKGMCPNHGVPSSAPTVTEPGPKQTPKVRAFLEAVVTMSRAVGLSISHEDGHGAFLVVDHDPYNDEWMRQAFDDTAEGKKLR